MKTRTATKYSADLYKQGYIGFISDPDENKDVAIIIVGKEKIKCSQEKNK